MKQLIFIFLLFISIATFGQNYSEQNLKCSEILKDIPIGSDVFWEKLKLRDSCLVGLQAPFFEGTTLENEKYNLENLKGKVIVVNFWFTRCAACIKEMPYLNKIVSKYKNNKNVIFLSFANEDSPTLKKFLKSKKFDFKVIPDASHILIDTFKLFTAWPTSIIINKEGKISFIQQDSIDSKSNFKDVLDEIVN